MYRTSFGLLHTGLNFDGHVATGFEAEFADKENAMTIRFSIEELGTLHGIEELPDGALHC